MNETTRKDLSELNEMIGNNPYDFLKTVDTFIGDIFQPTFSNAVRENFKEGNAKYRVLWNRVESLRKDVDKHLDRTVPVKPIDSLKDLAKEFVQITDKYIRLSENHTYCFKLHGAEEYLFMDEPDLNTAHDKAVEASKDKTGILEECSKDETVCAWRYIDGANVSVDSIVDFLR